MRPCQSGTDVPHHLFSAVLIQEVKEPDTVPIGIQSKGVYHLGLPLRCEMLFTVPIPRDNFYEKEIPAPFCVLPSAGAQDRSRAVHTENLNTARVQAPPFLLRIRVKRGCDPLSYLRCRS